MLAARPGRGGRRPAAAGARAGSGTGSRLQAAGPTTATSATRVCSCSTRARRACSPTGAAQMVDDEEWDWIVDHSLGAFDHLVIASTLPVFMPHGIHHLAVVERGASAPGAGAGRPRSSERAAAARASTSSTGRHSTSRSSSCATGCAASRAGEAARRRPRRSCCSAATCTTAPSAEVDLGAGSRSRVLPARLLAVPQPAVAEGAAHRRRHRLAARRADLRGARAARRRDRRRRRRGVRSRRTFENTLGELLLDGRAATASRSGGARRKARIPRPPRRDRPIELLRADPSRRISGGAVGR